MFIFRVHWIKILNRFVNACADDGSEFHFRTFLTSVLEVFCLRPSTVLIDTSIYYIFFRPI